MTILCVLGGDAQLCRPQIETAIDFAKRLGSPLKALLAMPDPANAAMYMVSAETVMVSASGIAAVKEAQDTARSVFRAVFDDCVADAGSWLKADFVNETGSVAAIVSAHAILSDATLFPHEASGSGHPLNGVLEHVMMDERIPVQLASKSGAVAGSAVIAWDGSPRAMRSVRAHLPLIRAIGDAIIAHNPKKTGDALAAEPVATPAALADWLHDERITAKVEVFDGKVSEGLLALSEANNAGLIVMGAYGHSRIGQMLFGGTSRALMNAEQAPALALAH